MMATIPHVTSGSGLGKYQANGFLLDCVYMGKVRNMKYEFKKYYGLYV